MRVTERKISTVEQAVAAGVAAMLLFSPVMASDGSSLTGLLFAAPSTVRVSASDSSTPAETLLVVGSGRILADDTGSWMVVLGQTISITMETRFPRGIPSNDDYVAVTGEVTDEGNSIATSIVRLGGSYVQGSSPIYLRGQLSSIEPTGRGTIGPTTIDLAQAYYNASLLDLQSGAEVEVLGYEVADTSVATVVIATTASSLNGINGSGARGINGSGAKGINGSGARGINGSGAKGINGSGARGINGSGSR